MWVNRYQSSSAIYAKLAEKYAQLAKIDAEEQKSSYDKVDSIEASGVPKNLDANDYQRVLQKFKNSDSQVRAHEQAHASSGAATTSAIQYNYQTGPDGKLYAVGGSVRLETSIPKDEKAAAFKLNQLQNAASAPNNLSGADAQIARTAVLNKMLLQLKGDSNANQ
ncbi:MAG: putative metalloprotease CJM1_0395 family protein [Candidatus Marinarcus sp.]|uniref:putative metalloprotease CJM1_0395 family protein n=1 Tax=Candidatus Marinarcus sp. TaxID=3100987 RepID=UPI003AFFEFA8